MWKIHHHFDDFSKTSIFFLPLPRFDETARQLGKTAVPLSKSWQRWVSCRTRSADTSDWVFFDGKMDGSLMGFSWFFGLSVGAVTGSTGILLNELEKMPGGVVKVLAKHGPEAGELIHWSGEPLIHSRTIPWISGFLELMGFHWIPLNSIDSIEFQMSKCPVSIDSKLSTVSTAQELLRAASPSVDAGNLLAMVVKVGQRDVGGSNGSNHAAIYSPWPSYTKLCSPCVWFL